MDSPIIRCGLEVHAQLNFLQTKLFCSCRINNDSKPNFNTCPICRGLPGTLPSVNGTAVLFGLKLAKALSMKPNLELKFSRKHYDYPDLPKGFQITQNLDGILGTDGLLPCQNTSVPIRQIQLEEDPAKLSYQDDQVIVDYNRCGITLIELVTDPVFSTKDQIKSFLQQYRRLLFYLQICDSRKESSFRADVNVSVGTHPRVEVKNVGSDADIIDAFEYEVQRQKLVTDFTNIGMETRNWDSLKKITTISRDKESNSDYKYMPEGNIPPIEIPESVYETIELKMLPWELEQHLQNEFDVTDEQLQFLLDNIELIDIFKNIMNIESISKSLRMRFFWQDYLSWFKIKDSDLSPEQLIRFQNLNISEILPLLNKLEDNKLSNQEFKKIFRNYIRNNKSLQNISELNNSENFTKSVLEYLKLTYPNYFSELPIPLNKVNYLVGLGVKYSKGKVNPKVLQEVLKNL